MRTILLLLVPCVGLARCSDAQRLSPGPSHPSGVPFATVTPADQLRYVRPADQITRPDLVSNKPQFIFETAGTLCPQTCETEAWDGTTLSCLRIDHIPGDTVTLYVVDPARAGVNGSMHGAYRADSITFRGQALRSGPCTDSTTPATCAILSISSFTTPQ